MLKKLLSCAAYLAVIGIVNFFVGRIIPKGWLNADKFPFKSFKFEKNGKIYDALKVKKWQNRVPDMSRLFRKLMPEKKFSKLKEDAVNLMVMISETCIAELIHVLLFIEGFGCVFLWKGWGWLVTALYNIFGNVTFIIIQRYNRPRLKACAAAAERAGLQCA